jgi:hypothetical protein
MGGREAHKKKNGRRQQHGVEHVFDALRNLPGLHLLLVPKPNIQNSLRSPAARTTSQGIQLPRDLLKMRAAATWIATAA